MKKQIVKLGIVAMVFALAAGTVRAASYYWDSNGTTAGLGDIAGTWGTSTFVGTVPGGILNGTAATAGTVTLSGDSIYFGTVNLSLGSAASTIGIAAAGVTNNIIVFGAGQTNAVTLGGGGGTITLAGTTPTLSVNNTSDTIAAILDGTAGLTKAGAGTLTLTAVNTFTGGTTIQGGGTLTVGNGTTGSFASQALTFNSGGGVFNAAEASGSSQGMGALTFSAGEGAVISTAAGVSPTTATLTFASLAARPAGASGNFSLSVNTTSGENKIVLTSTANAPLSSSGSGNIGFFFGGTEYARYDTVNNYLRAVSYGSDNNASAVVGSGATLGINDATKDVKISGDITAQTTASVNTLNLAANNLTLQDSSQILSVNGILSAGAASASIATAGKIQATANGGEILIRVNGSSDGLSIAPVIQNAGGTGTPLTKSGAGTLTLSGANTYTGPTTINGGTLALSGGAAIADTGAVALANAAGATLLLNASETIGSLSGGGFAGGNVNVGANTLTIANANSLTFGGQITGTSGGGVVITTGTLTLSGKNTFAGTITLNGTSQLNLTYGSDGTSSTPAISSGGTISMANGTSLAMKPTAQVAAGVAVGELGGSVSVGNVVSNLIVVSSGTATIKQIVAGGPRYVFSGGVTGGTSGSQILNIHQGAGGGNCERTTFAFSGIIQNGSGGTLGVSADFKSASTAGQGAFICLSGQHTFTGPIVVNNTVGLLDNGGYRGAWLVIGGEITSGFSDRTTAPGTGYLGGGNYTNTISLATGTILNYMSSANQTLGGVISGTGRILKEGSGTLTLSGNNTYAGITTVSVGTLTLASNLALQNSALVTTDGGKLTLDTGVTTPTIGGLSGASGNLATIITNGYGNVTALTLNPLAGVSVTYGGVITNGAAGMTLTKSGPGTQTLTSANSYSGGTTISAGILAVSGNGTLGSGDVSVAAGGMLSLSSASTSAISNTNRLTLVSGAVVNLGAGVNETVNELYINGELQKSGTWGTSASSPTPTHIDDGRFAGTGILTVLKGRPVGTVILLF